MKKIKNYKLLMIFLLPLGVFLNYLASLNPEITEKYYSVGINKVFRVILSRIFSIFPFSLYDISIVILILVLIFYIGVTVIRTIREKKTKALKNFALNLLVVISIFYFLFVFLWGINYNRLPVEKLMGLEMVKTSEGDLEEVYKYLILKANETRQEITKETEPIKEVDFKEVLENASLGYENVSEDYLKGSYGKPVRFIFSEFFNYTGITGVYFPYTGQAGVNVNAPATLIPVTTLHEMAHQRGFAREDEANFLAFYVGVNHSEGIFKYSSYLLAISNVRGALGRENREKLKELDKLLSEGVKNDINYNINFWEKYEGKIDEIGSKINDTYLKSNGISDGEKSYGRMVDLLLKYYNMYIKSEMP